MDRDDTAPLPPPHPTPHKSDDWTEEELTAAAEAYQQMVAAEQRGERFTKKAIYQDLADRFPRTVKAFEFRMQNISAIRMDLGLPTIKGLRPADHIGSNKRPQLERIVKEMSAAPEKSTTFKYGNSPSWHLPINAIIALGGRATPAQIRDHILKSTPSYQVGILQAALYRLSVNSPSRVHYPSNTRPRISNQGNQFDRLFQTEFTKDCAYELYDPAIHGTWEIFREPLPDGESRLSVREVSGPTGDEGDAGPNSQDFDPDNVNDTRRRRTGMLVSRHGQALFRRSLLVAYRGTCAVSGSTVEHVLQAAHIRAYSGHETDVISNGLLLRVDVHTLFDKGLIWVDIPSMAIRISERLRLTEYWDFNNRPLGKPYISDFSPSQAAFEWHFCNRVKEGKV